MKIEDIGVFSKSCIFSLTPPDISKSLMYYPVMCGHYYCMEKYYIKRDTYPPLLVMFIRDGSLRVEYQGEVKYAKRGDVVLLDCQEPHYYHASNNTEFLYMHFDGLNSHELCRYIIQQAGWLIQRENNILIGKYLSDMIDFCKSNEIETPLESSMRIYNILNLLIKPTSEEQRANTPIEDAIYYIRTHIGEPISLEKLAEIARLSTYYFAHSFKQKTGFAPLEFVINTRIERAKALLLSSFKTTQEIAYEVGYGSSNSFINAFVKRVGMSPHSYRNEHMGRIAKDSTVKNNV